MLIKEASFPCILEDKKGFADGHECPDVIADRHRSVEALGTLEAARKSPPTCSDGFIRTHWVAPVLAKALFSSIMTSLSFILMKAGPMLGMKQDRSITPQRSGQGDHGNRLHR